MASSDLFTYHLDQYPFPPRVKLAVEDSFPSAKVEPAIRHRHHHLAAHDLPLQVRVGIPVTSFRTGVLAGAVVQPASGPA